MNVRISSSAATTTDMAAALPIWLRRKPST